MIKMLQEYRVQKLKKEEEEKMREKMPTARGILSFQPDPYFLVLVRCRDVNLAQASLCAKILFTDVLHIRQCVVRARTPP